MGDFLFSNHQERYRPGQLDLGLNAAKAGDTSIQTSIQTCDVILASYTEFQPFQNDLQNSPFRPTLCALKNLKGTLLYFQKKYHSALDEFNAVLKMDEENLNARQNLYETYRELGCWTKAAEFENAENKINDEILKARCQGEQAFSIMFDCHIAVNDSERYKRGLFLFQQCTKISFKDPKEDIQWTLWFLQLVLRSFKGASEPKTRIQESLERLMNKVFLTLKKDENKLLYSMALGTLARFINLAASRYKMDFETFDELSKDNIKEKVPELADIKSWFEEKGRPCFRLAYETYPYVESIVRFQRNLKMGASEKSLEEALDLYKKADGKLLDTLNKDWFTMSTVSEIYLELFRVKCQMHDDCHSSRQEKTKDPKTEEMQNLQTSESAAHTKVTNSERPRSSVVESRSKETKKHFIEDLDKCIEYGEITEKLFQSSELFNNIAISYHEKASCEEDKDKREEYFLKACSYFNHAIKHSDGKCQPFIHVGLGNCLFEMKEYRPAVESYTSAIECSTKNKNIYKFLMKAYIALLQEQGSQNPETEKRLLNEICYWLKYYKQVKENADKNKTDKPTTDSVKSFILEDIRKDNESTDRDSSESRLVDSVYGRIVATYYEKVMGHKNDEDDDPEECLKHIISVSCLQERTFLSVTVLSEIIKSPNMYPKFMDFIIRAITISSHNLKEATVIADAFNIQQQSSNTKFDCDVNLLLLMRKLRANKSLADCVRKIVSEKYKKLFAILRHEFDEEHETAMPTDEEDETDLPEDEDENSIAGILVNLNQGLVKPKLRKQLSLLEQRIISFHSHNARCCSFEPTVSQRKEPRTRQTKYEYDFYVIASESDRDRDYVVNKLLPTLEISHGFKGCIDERDSRIGHYKLEEMMQNIKKSFRILIVISEDSEKNQLFKFKLQQAVNENMERKGEALIPLILEQMDKRLSGSVPDELKALMSVKSSDLEKLVRALEDNS